MSPIGESQAGHAVDAPGLPPSRRADSLVSATMRFWAAVVPVLLPLWLTNQGCRATISVDTCSIDTTVTCTNVGDVGYSCSGSDVTPSDSAGECAATGDVTFCCTPDTDASIPEDVATCNDGQCNEADAARE